MSPFCCCIARKPICAPEQRRILEQLRETDATLVGKKVLVVDDDVRNIFALTSLLEDHNLKVAARRKRARRHRTAEARRRISTWC